MSELAHTDMFDDARSVERPQFFNGQELFAADLEGIAGFNRAMRWLHNRSLHQAGIGNGFAVSGKKGDREVQVQAGYALNARGQEIVLLDTDVEPVPPVAAERDGGAVYFDLTVSYPSDDDLEEAETRKGICRPRGVVRLRERPVFCWVRLERDADGRLTPVSAAHGLAVQAGLMIVLARAQVRNCRLDADLSIAERRNARPPDQPHIACGRQDAQWEAWTIEIPQEGGEQEVAIGLRAPVDTRAAGFRVTPCYSARVSGPRPLLPPPVIINGGPNIEGDAIEPAIIDLPAFPQDVAPVGFTCYLAATDLRGNALVGDLIARFVDAARKSWSVTWLGMED